jgi:hypothetical protein
MLSSIFGYLTSNGTLAPGSAGVAEREAGVAELFARFASCSCSLLKLSSPCLGAMFASSWLLGDDVDVVIGVRKHADRCSVLSARESLIAGGKSKMGDARRARVILGAKKLLISC